MPIDTIQLCFIHVMLSHWTHHKNSLIFTGENTALLKNNTILYDNWFLWHSMTLSKNEHSNITHVACQRESENRSDLSTEWGLYECNGTNEHIPRYYLCDKKKYCIERDDELSCDYHCWNSSLKMLGVLTACFECPDGEQIPLSMVSNGKNDCIFSKDESFQPFQKVIGWRTKCS